MSKGPKSSVPIKDSLKDLERVDVLSSVVFGVLSTPKFMATRVVAVASTWLRKVPTAYFISEAPHASYPRPVIVVKPQAGDKYKTTGAFKDLPGIVRMYHLHPNASWYFIADDDTYVVVPNLVKFLRNKDPRPKQYIGIIFKGGVFAYGGAGFILSNSLVVALLPIMDACIQKYLHIPAGDYRLGLCIKDFQVTRVAHTFRFQYGRAIKPFGATVSFHTKLREKNAEPQHLYLPRLDRSVSVFSSNARFYWDFSPFYHTRINTFNPAASTGTSRNVSSVPSVVFGVGLQRGPLPSDTPFVAVKSFQYRPDLASQLWLPLPSDHLPVTAPPNPNLPTTSNRTRHTTRHLSSTASVPPSNPPLQPARKSAVSGMGGAGAPPVFVQTYGSVDVVITCAPTKVALSLRPPVHAPLLLLTSCPLKYPAFAYANGTILKPIKLLF
eukprot:CAMPEP_0196664138 /NCGR_PEP_ID=MMETSP1086-20130531/55833_1 /TAXON_ID=77921 /ORGANISM="Cyanoptyche  gloeocystis , Strain SAG4.97" /LENGTH=438 /DNA_ID=CAMNT_0042000293 /DNA_START=188 /DNA_END=1504 /DNA_ORIENTATION=+